MNLSHEALYLIFGIFFLLCFHLTSEEYGFCPIGFDLAYDEIQNEYICYKLKGPETFKDKYVDCEENIYSLQLHFRLNITRHSTDTFWIDYSSLYPGGPYLNWENTKDATSVMNNICYDLSHNNNKSCLIVTNTDIFIAVECNDMHYRYCFVEPNLRNSDLKFHRKYLKKSTKNMCRLNINTTSNVTWTQAKSLCEDEEMPEIDKELLYGNMTWEAEQLMNQVLHDLKQLLANEEDHVVIEDLVSVFDQVNCFLDLKLDLRFPDKLARLLHELGPRVDLPAIGTANVIRNNIVLEMSLQSPIMFVYGLIVHRHYRFTENALEYIYSSNLSSTFYQNATDAVVTIPESIIWSFNRWNFLVLWDDNFFHDPRGMYTVNSRVISVNLNTSMDLESTRIKIYLRPLVLEESNMRRTCVHWNFSDDVFGYWTEDGCTLIRSDDPELLDTCECNLRFTYYAEALTLLTDEEFVAQLLNDLRALLESEVDPFVSDLDHIFDQLNDLLVLDHDVVFPAELLHLLQELGPRVDISPNSTSAIVRNSTALLIFVQRAVVLGITVARSDENNFTEHTFNFIPGFLTDGIHVNMLDVNAYDAVMTLPELVLSYTPGVSFMVFLDDRAFNDSLGLYTIISRVLSSNVISFEEFENETKDLELDLHLRPLITEGNIQSRRTCVRWIFHDDVNGFWSEEGCKLIEYDDPELLDTCKCKLYLTYYAMASFSLPVTTTESTIIDSTTEMMPDEIIQQILEDLNQLLNQATPILVDDISPVFDQVDHLLNLDQEIDFPGQMPQLLEELGTRVDLNGALTSAVVRNSIGLLMADVTEDNPVQGLVVASRDTEAFTQDSFEFLIGDVNSSLLNVNVSEAVVKLPQSVTRHPRRISFVVYRYGNAFSDSETYTINSNIVSVSVENHTQFERGEVVDIHLKPIIQDPNRDERRVCAYWHFLEDQSGYWSQEGCTFIRSRNPWVLDTCRCNHLTHFTEILVPRPVFSQRNEDALEILSVIGSLLSILGVVIIILTAVFFRSWRKNFRNQIWLQLCIALFIMSLCFLAVVYRKYEYYSFACVVNGISLHYSILASFCWMLVVAVKSYNDLVLVFIQYVPRKRLIASSFSWGVPVVIIGILLSVNPQSYSGHFEEMNPSSKFCYPSGTSLWITVYTPIAVILLANWTIFILIVRQIGFVPRSSRPQKPGDIREAMACIRLSIVLIFLFGLPWVFGLFAFNIVAAYLFSCTVTTQGFVLFLLIVCGNTQTRNLWFNKLKRKQHKSFTVTSDYY